MSSARLPDFEHMLDFANGYLEATELAECHGVACGLLCAQAGAGLDMFIGLLDLPEWDHPKAADFNKSLRELFNTSREQLADEDMGFSIWLPGDTEILEDRTMALAQWCYGFLTGLGSSGDSNLQRLSDEANEALKDLQQISLADVSDTSGSEDDEVAFAEIVEYIRVAILLIRQELLGPERNNAVH